MSESQPSSNSSADRAKGSVQWPDVIRRAVAGVAFHLFATIALVALAAPGVTSWETLAAVGMVGLTVDVLRHVFSPECRTDPATMWGQFESGITKTPNFKRSLLFWKIVYNCFFVSWIFYYVLFAIKLPPNEANAISAYFSWAAPIETIYSAISSIDRRAVSQLIEHGYPNRAQVVSFFYASNAVFFVLCGVITFSGYTFVMSFYQIWKLPRRGHQATRPSTMLWTAVGLFLFGLFCHLLMSNAFHLRWNDRFSGFSWNLAENNEGITYYGMGEAASAGFVFFSYQAILIARCMEHRRTGFLW